MIKNIPQSPFNQSTRAPDDAAKVVLPAVLQGSASEKALKGHDLKGARQLTIKHRNSYRVAYIAEFEDVVVVLHCFKKQTEGRQSKDMKTVAARLAGAYGEFSYKT